MQTLTRRRLLHAGPPLVFGLTEAANAFAKAKPELLPYGALPSPRQLAWHRKEVHGFIHFTVNTFTDKEWGYGDEPESLFNPTDFSATQIVDAARSVGMTGLILTAKHHDGFCLWPSAYTAHSIKNSPYKGGKGDIVREMADACAAAGLEFGVYLSPWDRNHAEYGRPAYVNYYHNQLHELTTQYGKLFEVWFDGANGGDGYYGGARESRKIDGKTYYQWDKVREIVRMNQPDAVMFADANMDIRWVGNEDGVAGDPCWPTVDSTPFTREIGNHGIRGGNIWNPAETDVSIRPSWFWHADETPKSPATLTRIYFESVGRGSPLLLNLAPDRRGRIPDADVASLKGWRAIQDQTFSTNLAQSAQVSASSIGGSAYLASNALKPKEFWAAASTETANAWMIVKLPRQQTFDVIQFSEDLRYGLRVDDFAVDIRTDGDWSEISRHTAIGPKRLIRLDAPVTAKQVRLRILSAAASPIIGNFGLFKLPDIIEEPVVMRDGQGNVQISTRKPDYELFYTIDGGAPAQTSLRYRAPFSLTEGGTVRAIARNPKTGVVSAETIMKYDVAPVGWRVVMATGDTPAVLLTGGTLTGFPDQPLEIVLDLGRSYDLKGFSLKPPSPANHPTPDVGPPARFEVYTGQDAANWILAQKGEFSNIAANRATQVVAFGTPVQGRYLKLVFPVAVLNRSTVAIDGVGIITR